MTTGKLFEAVGETIAANLPRAEVHVWRYQGSNTPRDVAALWQILSPDEQAKTKRQVRPQDQAQAITSRGVLRILLGRYLAIAPDALVFSYGPQGKPALDLPKVRPPSFNVSHSGNQLLLAFGPPDMHIGVDIEQHRPIPEWQDIARQYFHPKELAALLKLPTRQQSAGFFDCWTRKEAVVKSLGTGISLDLQSFAVPIQTEHAECLVALPADYRTKHCTLKLALPRLDHYSTAIAVYGTAHDGALPLVLKSIDADLR